MVQHVLAKAALWLALGAPVLGAPAACNTLPTRDAASFDDLVAFVGPAEVTDEPAVYPEYFPVPADLVVDEEAYNNFTLANTPSLNRRDILGDDNRYQWDSADYPWRPMGKVTFTAGNANYLCSGVLIGPRHVLTAQHCARGDNWRNGRFGK